jgi:hypothetical protein
MGWEARETGVKECNVGDRGRRVRGRLGLLAFLVTLVASERALADIPQIVVAGKGQRYVVWLDPLLADGTTKPPLTDANILRYCGAAQGFAERMWRVTNGRHRVFQVEFNYGRPPMRNDIVWRRYHSPANASRGGGIFWMYDAITEALHSWSEGSTPGSDREACLPDGSACIQANCPEGLTLQVTSDVNREICLDSNGTSPLEPATSASFVLAHEAAHSHYNLPDEYHPDSNDPVLYGFGVCVNPDWRTSMMAARRLDLWCDVHTHLAGRTVASPYPGIGNKQVTNLSGAANMWTEAQAFWADLASYDPGPSFTKAPGSQPQNEYFTDAVGPWQPLPSDTFCVFTGDEFPSAVMNDLVVVVDKSGSMGYKYSTADVTAFEAAFAAGLGHFNRTAQRRKSGLTVFDSAVTRSIPYQTNTGARSVSEFNLAAGGTTNLCGAISDTAQQIRAGGTSDATGHMVLLTDGRPTVAGCDTPEAVRRAAFEACQPSDGSKPVVISALAFGDADYALIQQISDICGGESRTTDGSGQGAPAPPAGVPPGSPAPLNIKVAGARLAYQQRGYTEAMFAQEPKPLVFERTFDVPPGTPELELVWMGQRTIFIVGPNGGGSFCRFANDYGFEVLDPSGNPAGSDIVTPSVELAYVTRTRRVTNPTPGRWTMRTTGGAPCVVGGTRPAPDVAMFAVYRNHNVQARVSLDKGVIANDERVRATAVLEIGPGTAATDITVTARLVNGGIQMPVPMRDDGSNGDDVAGDGLYTGIINPACAPGNLPPGGYRFQVELVSNAATARSVVLPDRDVEVALGVNPTPRAVPISVSVVEEKLVTIAPCNSPAPGCSGPPAGSNLCPQQQTTVQGDVSVGPGEGRSNVSVTVRNCPIASYGVTVGAGAGVFTSNVRSTYNDVTGTGTVTFDVTASPRATVGERQVSLFWGRQRCDTSGAVISVCRALPSELEPVTHAVCQTGATVELTFPDVSQGCITNPAVTGAVVSSDGVPRVPPLPIDASGRVALEPGIHVVEWTVSNGAGQVATARQTVHVLPGISAGGLLFLRDRARAITSGSGFAPIANLGPGGLTEIGVEAHSGDIRSVPSVFVRDRGNVHGFVRTGGQLTLQNQTVITGPVQQGAQLSLGGLVNPSVVFPAPPGPDVSLEPDQVGSRSPGALGRVTMKSRARLTFTDGDYLIEHLDIEPQAELVISAGTRLFVRSSMIYRGRFRDSSGGLAKTFLAYYGSAALVLESEYSGVLLADSASVALGSGSNRNYSGVILARDIELRPDVTFTCTTTGGPVFELLSANAPAWQPAEPSGTGNAEVRPAGGGGCQLSPKKGLGAGFRALMMMATSALLLRRRRRASA